MLDRRNGEMDEMVPELGGCKNRRITGSISDCS